MLRNVYGLDLGTYDVKIYDKRQNKIVKEKNVIAIEDGKKVCAHGNDAYKMFEKNPENIEIIFPMQNGEISHLNNMQYLLHCLINQGKRRTFGANYLLAIPSDVTSIQKKAYYDLMTHSSAKAKEISVIWRGIADAIGFGLNPQKEKGLFIINIGSDTTELSVLSYGEIVLNKIIKIGGSTLDNSIIHTVRRTHNISIGKVAAETLRNNFGLFDEACLESISVSGQHLTTGAPVSEEISIHLVRAAIKESLDEIGSAIKSMLERTPPDILSEIQKNGLYITGGLSRLSGLTSYVEHVTNLKIIVPRNPELSTIKGLKQIIASKELQKLAHTMPDEKFRWMK